MDDATYKILDILTRNLGKPISIHELTGKIEEIHGGAYYANIHEKICHLAREGTITLARTGRSSLTSLNFQNYLIIDLLAEMELRKKQDFLKGRQEMQMLVMEIGNCISTLDLIKSITLINPERNAKLNRAEILIHIKKSDNRKMIEDTKLAINTMMKHLQMIHTVRSDPLIIEGEQLLDLLKSSEANPLQEMLHDKIAIFHPQDFWLDIRNAISSGSKIASEENETHPAKISEQDLLYNLARFGYTEFGPKIKQGKPICIEYIITAVMFQNDARKIDAIPIILAKNSKKTNYDLLLFLAQKYGFEGRILGILRALRNLAVHGLARIDEPIRLLEVMKVKETKANEKSIKEKLRLYNVS